MLRELVLRARMELALRVCPEIDRELRERSAVLVAQRAQLDAHAGELLIAQRTAKANEDLRTRLAETEQRAAVAEAAAGTARDEMVMAQDLGARAAKDAGEETRRACEKELAETLRCTDAPWATLLKRTAGQIDGWRGRARVAEHRVEMALKQLRDPQHDGSSERPGCVRGMACTWCCAIRWLRGEYDPKADDAGTSEGGDAG